MSKSVSLVLQVCSDWPSETFRDGNIMGISFRRKKRLLSFGNQMGSERMEGGLSEGFLMCICICSKYKDHQVLEYYSFGLSNLDVCKLDAVVIAF